VTGRHLLFPQTRTINAIALHVFVAAIVKLQKSVINEPSFFYYQSKVATDSTS